MSTQDSSTPQVGTTSLREDPDFSRIYTGNYRNVEQIADSCNRLSTRPSPLHQLSMRRNIWYKINHAWCQVTEYTWANNTQMQKHKSCVCTTPSFPWLIFGCLYNKPEIKIRLQLWLKVWWAESVQLDHPCPPAHTARISCSDFHAWNSPVMPFCFGLNLSVMALRSGHVCFKWSYN